METRLPDFNETCKALNGVLPLSGLQSLGGDLYSWNCARASECHNIPDNFNVFTLRELVSQRVHDTEYMLDSAHITLRDSKAHSLLELVKKVSTRLIPLIPPTWTGRFKTATIMYRSLSKGDIEYIDIPNRFRNPGIDYSDVSDGGAKITHPFKEEPYSNLKWDDYLVDKGGNRVLADLERHNIIRAMIPDQALRKRYLSCLAIFDMLLKPIGKQSLWAPGQIMPGYARFQDLGGGIKQIETSFYPPNCTTEDHRVILKINSAKS